jgi:hypothetical protein
VKPVKVYKYFTAIRALKELWFHSVAGRFSSAPFAAYSKTSPVDATIKTVNARDTFKSREPRLLRTWFGEAPT